MTHLVYQAWAKMTHCYIWRILYLTHIVFFVQYIQNMWGFFSEFLCKMLYMCSVFYMIFVQFLGVCKWFDNPFCAICRLAHTKNPHRANFSASDLFVTTIGEVHQEPNHLQGSINPSKLICLFRVEPISALYYHVTLTTK